MVENIDLAKLSTWKPDRLRREVRAVATRLAQASPEMLNEVERDRLVDEIVAESFGLGPLDNLMGDTTVSDILVNGPNEVYVERDGRLELTDIVFADNAHLMQIIQRIAARVGRRVDEMSPMVDARLPDGSRVNAIVPPLALQGPVLSIRRFGVRLECRRPASPTRTMAPPMLDLLRAAVAGRVSMLISGGTGAGKTTLLNTLSRFIPSDERLVTIRGFGRVEAAAAARRPPGNAAAKSGRRRRGQAARPGPQRLAHAARPHHRRRSARRRGTGHAPGHEHRPRRELDHDPRQRHARRARPAGNDGDDGRLRDARAGHSPIHRLGGRAGRAVGSLEGRSPQNHENH